MLRRLPANNRNNDVRREYDNVALQRLLRYALCALVLAVGFVCAAWQHFATTRYGYDYEKLRLERLHLEAESNSLRAKQENMLALRNVESRALAAGLQPLQPSQIETLQNGIPRSANAARTTPQPANQRPARR